MKIAIFVFSFTIALLFFYGCSTPQGTQVLKTEGDSVTVLHQGQKIKIKPDGVTPEKGKGIVKHGIFIYAGDAASSAVEVRKGLEQSVTVPTEDWTREPDKSGSDVPVSQE